MAADVPYTPFPSVQPSVDGLPPQSVPAGPEEFGAGVGRSFRRTAQVMRQAQEAEFAMSVRLQEQQNETMALDASTEFSRRANALELEYRKLKGQQAVDAYPQFEKSLGELEAEIGKGLKAPSAARQYKARSSQYRTSSLQTIGLHAASEGDAAAEAADIAAIQAAQSRFANHFGVTDTRPDIDQIVSLSAQRAAHMGLPKEAADILVQKNVGEALKQVIGLRLLSGDIKSARAVFEESVQHTIPGTDLPTFDAQQIEAISEGIDRAESLQLLDEQRKIAAADKARRDASEATYSRAMGQIMVDPTKVDIKALGLDPNLSGEHKGSILRLYDEKIKDLQGGGDPDANKGPGFWDAFRQVTAAKPTITTPTQIYDMTGRGRPLTLQGANALVALMKSRQSGENVGNYDTQMIARFMTNARGQITNGIDGDADLNNRAFQFYMDKMQQLDEGKAKGKTINDMLNPKSPDYIGADWQTYLPEDEEAIEETQPEPATSWLGFIGNALFGERGFRTEDLDRTIPAGESGSMSGISALRAAVAAGKVTRSAAEQYAIKRGWVRLDDAPVAPTRQTVPAAMQ